MKTLAILSAIALLAASGPVLAQDTSGAASGLQKNGSPNGAAGSAAKQPGKSDAGAGQHEMSEGRSSATDSQKGGETGAASKMSPGTGASGSGQ